ncbi:alpha-L-fucosidase [Sinomicrobium weinanense]|uniref:alpha-L-fucosidase n=1 Tax=Sinomicrobium weinanense TaxID=2842200 RepID=A0A926Q4P5_9FLAO|nr:alpha-L-fucosidase [Sinomicrobium weinanense]MBC9798204.1 alpha-L-fucosidase [Sinomicrobium weinanense]MBU3123302.1 alpha-L-fucosidase [Sinomicrobium weinanense]
MLLCLCCCVQSFSQEMQNMWTKEAGGGKEHPNIQWFKEAKFGMFIHWGLYSKIAGTWKDSTYYGSGEWIMKRAKISADEYAGLAATFNPVGFNAEEWAQVAKDAGMKYMVITAKHHEGFAMYDSKVTDFDIVDASPYGKDPMKALARATRKRGIKFGFYYSQFQDWHEPDGGGNTRDFDKEQKDYRKYYREKAIPQLKELLRNYGPLGMIWFDTPGGLTKEETRQMIDDLRGLQPETLFSSRVGHGLGDYRDFGDSEVPPVPIKGAWESIYTHNDSWGYIAHDKNFKSPRKIIHLLANIASKGGNLMLNVGPDGNGELPPYSVKYLREVGKWLEKNGESIYGTTHGLVPAQPWGVTTSGPGKLFLHVLNPPSSRNTIFVPGIEAEVKRIYILENNTTLKWQDVPGGIDIQLPHEIPDSRNTVLVMEYNGPQPDLSSKLVQTISRDFPSIEIPAITAEYKGNTKNKLFTFSHHFGDWKHENLAYDIYAPEDELVFELDIRQTGDYKVILDYACIAGSEGREGTVRTGKGEELFFRSLPTGSYDSHRPLLFIRHAVGVIHVSETGKRRLSVKPVKEGSRELFWLRKVILRPVD